MTFSEWLEEIEIFATRHERMIEVFDNNPSYTTIEAWLEAAYNTGYLHAISKIENNK